MTQNWTEQLVGSYFGIVTINSNKNLKEVLHIILTSWLYLIKKLPSLKTIRLLQDK